MTWTDPRPAATRRLPPAGAAAMVREPEPGQGTDKEVVELAVLGRRGAALLCRQQGSGARLQVIDHSALEPPVEGEIVTFVVERRRDLAAGWLTGRMLSWRLDARALGLEPLRLGRRATPSGVVEYELERPAVEAAAGGPTDRLERAHSLSSRGRRAEAEALLSELLASDLRCLDAHAALGYLTFRRSPERHAMARALRHFQAGAAIGGLSLPQPLDGRLPWGLAGNRPLLKCLFGRALCLWRLGRIREALEVFRRLRRLDPTDRWATPLGLESLIDRLK